MSIILYIIGLLAVFIVAYTIGRFETEQKKPKEDEAKTVYFGGVVDDRCTRRRNGNRCTRKVSRLSYNNWCNSCEDAQHGY